MKEPYAFLCIHHSKLKYGHVTCKIQISILYPRSLLTAFTNQKLQPLHGSFVLPIYERNYSTIFFSWQVPDQPISFPTSVTTPSTSFVILRSVTPTM